MGDSYATATHPALNSVCCYTLGGKPPCLKKKGTKTSKDGSLFGRETLKWLPPPFAC